MEPEKKIPVRWSKGQSGNPAGRPQSSRQRIAERLIADITDKWETHGSAVLEHLACNEPAKFAQIAYGLVPKDVFLSVAQQPPGNLSPESWQALTGVLDAIQAAKVGADVEPAAIFQFLEHCLRAEFAKPVSPAEPALALAAPVPRCPV